MDQEHREDKDLRHLSPAAKARLIDQLRAGVAPADLAHEFDVPLRLVRSWARQERRRVAVATNGSTEVDERALESPAPAPPVEDPRRVPPPARVPSVGWLREEAEPEPYVSVGRSARTHWRLVS